MDDLPRSALVDMLELSNIKYQIIECMTVG